MENPARRAFPGMNRTPLKHRLISKAPEYVGIARDKLYCSNNSLQMLSPPPLYCELCLLPLAVELCF